MASSVNHYETHLTLACREVSAIRDWTLSQQLKWTEIALESGDFPIQPMISFQGNSLPEQRRLASWITEQVGLIGSQIVRRKIEAAPGNSEVPISDDEAHSDSCYFEHHVKLLLPSSFDRDSLHQLVSRYGARLSRNARRATNYDDHERFATQRVFGVGKVTAEQKLNDFLAEIRHWEYHILEIEAEFVLEDTHLGLDQGWM